MKKILNRFFKLSAIYILTDYHLEIKFLLYPQQKVSKIRKWDLTTIYFAPISSHLKKFIWGGGVSV